LNEDVVMISNTDNSSVTRQKATRQKTNENETKEKSSSTTSSTFASKFLQKTASVLGIRPPPLNLPNVSLESTTSTMQPSVKKRVLKKILVLLYF
jgi:hypothetical protein